RGSAGDDRQVLVAAADAAPKLLRLERDLRDGEVHVVLDVELTSCRRPVALIVDAQAIEPRHVDPPLVERDLAPRRAGAVDRGPGSCARDARYDRDEGGRRPDDDRRGERSGRSPGEGVARPPRMTQVHPNLPFT